MLAAMGAQSDGCEFAPTHTHSAARRERGEMILQYHTFFHYVPLQHQYFTPLGILGNFGRVPGSQLFRHRIRPNSGAPEFGRIPKSIPGTTRLAITGRHRVAWFWPQSERQFESQQGLPRIIIFSRRSLCRSCEDRHVAVEARGSVSYQSTINYDLCMRASVTR